MYKFLKKPTFFLLSIFFFSICVQSQSIEPASKAKRPSFMYKPELVRRSAKYEEKLRAANTRDELESVARQWEYSLMLRMLGPHQGIRLERLRAELDDVFERQNQTLSVLDPNKYDQTTLVQEEMNQNEKQVPEISLKPDINAVGNPDEKGYEWITSEDGRNWYRTQGSNEEWAEFSN